MQRTQRFEEPPANILRVNVNAGFSVVQPGTIRMVRIVIDDYVVRASPAPFGSEFPISWKDFKSEASVEPETVVITVDPVEAIRDVMGRNC